MTLLIGGAVVYFAPNPKIWLAWLQARAGENPVSYGVVDLKVAIVPKVANELVRVVGKALVQTADLLDTARGFRERSKRPGLEYWRVGEEAAYINEGKRRVRLGRLATRDE